VIRCVIQIGWCLFHGHALLLCPNRPRECSQYETNRLPILLSRIRHLLTSKSENFGLKEELLALERRQDELQADRR
jgi:hypothetical protein